MSSINMQTKQTISNIRFRAHRLRNVFSNKDPQHEEHVQQIIINGETEFFDIKASLTVDEAASLAIELLESIEQVKADVTERDAIELRFFVDLLTAKYNLTNA